MKIAVNARTLVADRMEGVARYAWETTKQMILDHPEDTFYLLFDRPYDDVFLIADNIIPLVIRPATRHPILWKIWFDHSIVRAMRKYNIDVFYSPDGFCPVINARKRAPTCIVTHDLAYLHYPDSMINYQLPFYRRRVPQFHKTAEHIITVSESTRKDVIKQFGVEPQKVSVAYNALPPIIHEREYLAIEKPYFLYIGSIHPRKNIVRLLKAFDMFKKQHSDRTEQLRIAGRKAFNNDELETTLRNLKCYNDVIFEGQVSEKKKWSLIRQARSFVYVSLFEGFGIPLLEAFSQNIPVVTSDRGALAETAGKSAYLVDPENVEAIAKGLFGIVADEKLRQELVAKGAKRVVDFSWKISADHIYEVLTKINKSN